MMRDTPEVQQMLESLDSQGLIGLDFAFAGNRHLLMKDGFINSPDDLSGKKIRIIGSPAIQLFWDEIAAGHVAMPLSEVYTSLQTGVIDGMDIDLDALVTEKYYENAKYLTLTNHTTFPTVIVMSKKVFENLTEEERQIIHKSIKNAVDWGIDRAAEKEEENLQSLKELGVEVKSLDKDHFRNIIENVREELVSDNHLIENFIKRVEEIK